jgi:putative membrane protein
MAAGNDSPYARFGPQCLVLRDELAIDRTLLANERTLLAYLRSGIALVIAGATILHFAELGWFHAVGYACLPAGALALLIGVYRYRRMHRAIMFVRRKLGADSPDERGSGPKREDAIEGPGPGQGAQGPD